MSIKKKRAMSFPKRALTSEEIGDLSWGGYDEKPVLFGSSIGSGDAAQKFIMFMAIIQT